MVHPWRYYVTGFSWNLICSLLLWLVKASHSGCGDETRLLSLITVQRICTV